MGELSLRPVEIVPGFLRHMSGSALVTFGGTRVLCTAALEEGVPPFRKGSGEGWLSAEYAMLPGSTSRRKPRAVGKQDGRAVEIQRLIGRSLRAALDFQALGERAISIDCDVLEADGGTRTAAITGAFVALAAGVADWIGKGLLPYSPIERPVAAVSVGLVEDELALDLDYAHDSRAQVDMNVVMAGEGLIEVQGTGEGRAFDRGELDALLDLAQGGIERLFLIQKDALGDRARFVRAWDRPLVIATQNPGKLREMRALLGRRHSNVLSLAQAGIEEQAEETAATFEENAVLKAEHAMRATGFAALADDSGLEVDALGGAPGVYSARYAGVSGTGEERDRANLQLVLNKLADTPGPRSARFVCAVAYAAPGEETIVVRGTVEGQMICEARGADGFGYDPAFVADGDERTFAELTQDEKNQKSHRRNAITALLNKLDGAP